jgi:hypothetical protein
VAVVARLAFAAADRAEVLAPRRNVDERLRTHVAFEVPHAALNARFRLAFATRVARKWDGRCAA